MSWKPEGFSLLELAVVVAVLGILMAFAVPTLLGQQRKSSDRTAQARLDITRGLAQEAVAYNQKTFPATLATTLTDSVLGFTTAASSGPDIVSVNVIDSANAVYSILSDSGVCWAVYDHADTAPTYGIVSGTCQSSAITPTILAGTDWAEARTPVVAGVAVGFSGDDKVTVPSNTSLEITGDLTYEMWLRPTSFASRSNPLAKAYGGEGTITQEVDGSLTFYQGTSGGNGGSYEQLRTSAAVLPIGQWSYVVVTRQGSLITWYINGVADVSSTFTISASAGTLPLTIGSNYAGSYVGDIDEVAIYSKALSATEVAEHYTAMATSGDQAYTATVSATGPVGYWRLDEAGGTTAIDQTATNTGTYSGTPTFGQPGAGVGAGPGGS